MLVLCPAGVAEVDSVAVLRTDSALSSHSSAAVLVQYCLHVHTCEFRMAGMLGPRG